MSDSTCLHVFPGVIRNNYVSIGKCPLLDPMKNLDTSKFLGRWYQNSGSLFLPTRNGVCIWADFYENEDEEGELILEYGQRLHNVTGESIEKRLLMINQDKPKIASWETKYFKPHSKTEFEDVNPDDIPRFTILDTDYDNYAIAYSCQQWTTNLYTDVFWLFSRNTTQIDEDYEKMMEILQDKIPFMDEYEIPKTKHFDECYKDEDKNPKNSSSEKPSSEKPSLETPQTEESPTENFSTEIPYNVIN